MKLFARSLFSLILPLIFTVIVPTIFILKFNNHLLAPNSVISGVILVFGNIFNSFRIGICSLY